ncbi:MAG: type II toxin-antitoxin system VapC family toxin [Chloroflexi bacterium]|nr:type II toxin-antitoxin system VapC family toxin [Chloroflexota bacterium]
MSGKLLDTTTLIDLSRGNIAAGDFVDNCRKAQTPLFISVISAMELIFGCRDKAEVEKIKKLIADFTLLHLSPAESAQAYNLMLTYSKSHNLAIPDALIAATALTHNLELATDNERHFKMIPDLKVNRPY